MYGKVVEDGYIISFGVGVVGVAITEDEYNELASVFSSMPKKKGKVYMLKENLTWEERDEEPTPEPDPDAEEALSILLGGTE